MTMPKRPPTFCRPRWIEKLQVQGTCVLLLAGAFLAVEGRMTPADPRHPVTFLADGNLSGLLATIGLLAILSILSGIMTVGTRPSCGLLGVMCGAAAISVRSEPLGQLLLTRTNDLGVLYGQLIAEMGVLMVVLIAVAMLTAVVRKATVRLWAALAWTDPLAPEADTAGIASSATVLPFWVHRDKRWLVATFKSRGGNVFPPATPRQTLEQCIRVLLVAIPTTIGVVLLLLRSPERGQVVFSVAAGCFVGSLVAVWLFPVRSVALLMCVPFLAGVGLYAAIALQRPDAAVDAWRMVPAYGQALPIDWLTAGGTGTLFGYWLGMRIHENRLIDKDDD